MVTPGEAQENIKQLIAKQAKFSDDRIKGLFEIVGMILDDAVF